MNDPEEPMQLFMYIYCLLDRWITLCPIFPINHQFKCFLIIYHYHFISRPLSNYHCWHALLFHLSWLFSWKWSTKIFVLIDKLVSCVRFVLWSCLKKNGKIYEFLKKLLYIVFYTYIWLLFNAKFYRVNKSKNLIFCNLDHYRRLNPCPTKSVVNKYILKSVIILNFCYF